MRHTPDITGVRSGRLVALQRVGTESPVQWLCRCDCGNEVTVRCANVASGHTRSCGCLKKDLTSQRRRKHGESKGSRLYSVWAKMRARVHNPSATLYHRYGGRGIKVCEQWDTAYEPFRDWAHQNGYAPGLTIDRIDNDGNYEPSNCRWVTIAQQLRNTSRNRVYTYQGKTACLADHVGNSPLGYSRVRPRIARGWSIERALEEAP